MDKDILDVVERSGSHALFDEGLDLGLVDFDYHRGAPLL
jgi:hypothetical protein